MHSSSATDTTVRVDAAGNVGRQFAEALGRKDFERVMTQLDPAIDFRGLTPGRAWEASDARATVDDILRRWFDDTDDLEETLSIQTGSVSDRERVAYRFAGRNADGPFVVEQQAYYTQKHGRINWMRVLCSGFRPR